MLNLELFLHRFDNFYTKCQLYVQIKLNTYCLRQFVSLLSILIICNTDKEFELSARIQQKLSVLSPFQILKSKS